ncbi:hemerythrin domain-containing protein [Arthrobacter sp. H14-L1]|uniref:hemerythrin domain-containing protein n=1 Tax=Arthrobacter sp. H14-L1 TaxID=2996697 RepID=UPI00226D62E6|nr:hemerythrin domain-containing protein [Arthrobacter sp. H14-L1]MCY0905861.1 hemerythrin domain-containing protein [Arthrobacter sp. H14-L1]
MVVIHRMFRQQFSQAPQLVREVLPGDTGRSMIVGCHIAEFASALRHHHATEDERLWDTLESRSPACALHVSQMKAQHADVVALLDKLDAQLSQWQESADPAAGEVVAGILDEVNATLALHLGREEDKMLPVASMTMSQREWNKFQALGRASVPKNRLMVQLGYILNPLTPEERTAWMKAGLPGFVRLLYRLVGRRQHEADYRRVYGTVPG